MSPDGAIAFEGVWKRFRRFQHDGPRTAAHRLLGRSHRGDWWWVLRDIAFEVAPGDSLAIIGRNGSGKSTLVKLAAGHLFPYAGSIRVGGSIAAIVEMTAGTIGDLSGRENVRLIGNLIGRTGREVDAALTDIVDFAGLGHAIDRPYKFYSSGMKARLAFAATTAWQPDVLIIDEVLAVGDAEFGEAAERRIRDMRLAGSTLLFVSHDLTAVRSLCPEAILLQGGSITARGDTESVITAYEGDLSVRLRYHTDTGLDIGGMEVTPIAVPPTSQQVSVEVHLQSDRRRAVRMSLGLARSGQLLLRSRHGIDLPPGASTTRCVFDPLALFAGSYWLWLGIDDADGQVVVPWQRARPITLPGVTASDEPGPPPRPVPVLTEAAWSTVTGDT